MAIVNNLWLRGTKKRLAGTVVYQSMGQTIQREIAASVTNPRTEAQMAQRVRWANIVALYRVLRPMMKYAFESKKRTQSDYNAFMSANITTSPIALTKQEAAAAACVVAPYTITRGSLPSVSVNPDGNDWRTNIFMGNALDLDTCSVGQFSEQVLAVNPGLQVGDQISFVRLTQSVDEVASKPYAILRKYEVLLDKSKTASLSSYLPTDLLDSGVNDDVAYLKVVNNGGTGAFAIIVSRTVAGKTRVSTQSLTMVNMEDMLAAYSSAEQVAGAIASYGEAADVFLSSSSADRVTLSPIEITPVSASIDGAFFSPGDDYGDVAVLGGKSGAVRFNTALDGTSASVRIKITSGFKSAVTGTISEDAVNFTFPEFSSSEMADELKGIEVTIGNNTWNFKFYERENLE